MLVRIDHPEVSDAELKVVVETILHAEDSVVRRHHFNAEVRRRGKDFFVRKWQFRYDHIRNPDAVGADSHAKFGKGLQRKNVLVAPKPGDNLTLRVTMFSFTRISLQHLALDEIAVGPIAGAQVFVHRNECADAHGFIIALMKNDPIQNALAALDEIPLHTPEGRKQIEKALDSKSNLIAAKAARIAGDSQWLEIIPKLVATFQRLLPGGASADKGCAAKTGIARALNKLEYDGAELFLSGMKHRQPESVWGGSEDTAVDLRAVCAMGLAGSAYFFKLRELVNLLVDKEWGARAGAVRAIATVGGDAASLLLRFKALTGDREPDVVSDCFTGLLAVDGAAAVPLVASFAGVKSDAREPAILALGESRREDAVAVLKELFGRTADPEVRRCLLLSLATSRTESAKEFLLDLIRNDTAQTASQVMEAMSVCRTDPRTSQEIEEAWRSRT